MKKKLDAEEILAIVFISIVALLIMIPPILKTIGIAPNYSEGERTGVIVKLSKKGLFWKTWEGQMNLGGTNSQSDIIPSTFKFSVTDERLIDKIKSYLNNGEKVTLRYSQWFTSPFYEMETSYDIKEVKQ